MPVERSRRLTNEAAGHFTKAQIAGLATTPFGEPGLQVIDCFKCLTRRAGFVKRHDDGGGVSDIQKLHRVSSDLEAATASNRHADALTGMRAPTGIGLGLQDTC